MIGYWFSRENGKTEHLKTPARVRHSHRFEGVPIPCTCGLHASPTPWDALQYACGPILWEVELSDNAVSHGNPINKYAGKSRRYLRRVDLTAICRQFAAQQALEVIDLWESPAVIREYLEDEANGKDRSDIRDAARAAAWAAARAAARDAASAAAWDAAKKCFNSMALAALEEVEG